MPVRDGEWVDFETTVCWLEEEGEGLIKVWKTFRSMEERQQWMKERIDTGVVYDLLSFTESTYGGDPSLYPEVEMTPENGFVTLKPKEKKKNGTDYQVLYGVGGDGQSEEKPHSDQREGIQ